jgi:hypothetical protein
MGKGEACYDTVQLLPRIVMMCQWWAYLGGRLGVLLDLGRRRCYCHGNGGRCRECCSMQ